MKDKEVHNQTNLKHSTACISGKMMIFNRVVANIFRKHLKEFEITNSQLSILFVISRGEGLRQKHISERLILEKSTVNRNLSRLIKNGFITDKNDSRFILTEKGSLFLKQIYPHWQSAMTEVRDLIGEDGEDALNVLEKKLLI